MLGDEFKFVMNQDPDTLLKVSNIRMSKEPQVVRLRIYKVYTLQADNGQRQR